MQNLMIINRKEKKEFLAILERQFGFRGELDYAFLKNNKGKIFCISKDFSSIDLSELRINSIGLYFARQINNCIRLSIEGSQIVGKGASKNIVELSKEDMLEWIEGNDLKSDIKCNDFALLKYNNDFLGSGKCKDGKILNYVPKVRRINLHNITK